MPLQYPERRQKACLGLACFSVRTSTYCSLCFLSFSPFFGGLSAGKYVKGNSSGTDVGGQPGKDSFPLAHLSLAVLFLSYLASSLQPQSRPVGCVVLSVLSIFAEAPLWRCCLWLVPFARSRAVTATVLAPPPPSSPPGGCLALPIPKGSLRS